MDNVHTPAGEEEDDPAPARKEQAYLHPVQLLENHDKPEAALAAVVVVVAATVEEEGEKAEAAVEDAEAAPEGEAETKTQDE